MASTSEDLFAAIEAGDVARVRAMLEADPSLASARDAEGVSALMRARYRFDRGTGGSGAVAGRRRWTCSRRRRRGTSIG